MKRRIQIIYTILFFVICIVPSVFIPFVKADELAENRKLSEMPAVKNSDGSINLNWPSEFETYFSEHFAFRQQLVTLDSLEKQNFFNTSSNEKVIVGKDNWLFFASTLDDYMAVNTLSDRRIYNTAKTLGLIQEYAESHNTEFLFMSAPNKNTIYPQMMPSRYIKSGQPNNLDMLDQKLDDFSVNQLSLKELFLSQDKVLYHSRDSHWTNKGAVLVSNAVMDKLQIEHNDFGDAAHHTEQCWNGDLDSMLFPTMNNLSEEEIFDIDFGFDYIGSFKTVDDMSIRTVNENKEKSIIMYRDSFGRSMYPFISENVLKAEYLREVPYRIDKLETTAADYMIIEIVERNIPNLTIQAPVMPALSRSLDISADIYTSDKNICKSRQKSGYLQIYGVLDEYYFKNQNSDIYITLESGNGIYCFEAFPIFEAELLESDTQRDYGYSLYIKTDNIPSGEYAVNAYVGEGTERICTDAITTINI